MKKIGVLFIVFLLTINCVFGETYKVKKINYDISPCAWKFLGTTNPYCLEQNVPFNTNRVFESQNDLENYISDYKQRLYNLRAFELIAVNYSIIDTDADITNVELSVKLIDSMHLLAVPYAKYDSNSGFVFKLKAKDTNFLGTLNTMTSDFDFQLEQSSEKDSMDYVIAANFEYDYPFKAWIFDSTWVNQYGISYTIGDNLPEWELKTGLKFVLPLYNNVSIALEAYQSAINNFDYKANGDNIYFNEEVKLSSPIVLMQIQNWGDLKLTPYIDFNYAWDKDKISNLSYNYDLSGPELTPGLSFGTSRINWENNLRNGLNVSLTNSYAYNFERNIIYPKISFETKAYKSLNLYDGNILSRFGIAADFYAFHYFIDDSNPYINYDGNEIGERLRGIRNNQVYKGTDITAAKSISAIVLNLDFPIHIYSSAFTHKLLKYFNFDLQFSPFFDIALDYNKITKKYFDPKDGFYTGGLEVLVYPQKFSSYVVRASLGYDIGRKLFNDYLNMDWRQNVSKYEISFGLGLHY